MWGMKGKLHSIVIPKSLIEVTLLTEQLSMLLSNMITLLKYEKVGNIITYICKYLTINDFGHSILRIFKNIFLYV